MGLDFWHALITGLLVAVVFWIMHVAGLLANRTRGQKFMILLPVLFVVAVAANLVWSSGA